MENKALFLGGAIIGAVALAAVAFFTDKKDERDKTRIRNLYRGNFGINDATHHRDDGKGNIPNIAENIENIFKTTTNKA